MDRHADRLQGQRLVEAPAAVLPVLRHARMS
jgi:hypothetical protein